MIKRGNKEKEEGREKGGRGKEEVRREGGKEGGKKEFHSLYQQHGFGAV